MSASPPLVPPAILSLSRELASRNSTRSRPRRRRRSSSLSSSSPVDDYAALFSHNSSSWRRARSRSRSRTRSPGQSTLILGWRGSPSTHAPVNWKRLILSACRHGDIQLMHKLIADARLVPVRPAEIPSTDEMVLEALDAPSTGMLSALIRRDPEYRWSDLAVIKAIEKDKGYDPPLYLDVFLYLGLSPTTVYDQEVEHHDALMWAIRSSSVEFVSMLLCAGANPNGAKFKKLFAHIAVAAGIWQTARRPQFAIAYALIKHGADPNGTGALQWAVGRLAFGKIKDGRVPWEANRIAQMLIQQGGANINEVPEQPADYPPLRHALGEATFFENVDFIEYLLDNGAEPGLRSEKDPRTAWEIAVSEDGLPAVVDALVSRGISPATLWGILRP